MAENDLVVTCVACGYEIPGADHDCPAKPTVLQSIALQIIMEMDFCDHFCCGMTDRMCRAKILAPYLSKLSEVRDSDSDAKSILEARLETNTP